MLYHGLRHIMEQRIYCETNYTHTYYTQKMKLKSSTKMIKITMMTKKVAAVVTTMMMCDDDDYNDSE